MAKAKKTKEKLQVIIYTIIMNRKNYIHALRKCMVPGKFMADYTNDAKDAVEYEDEDAAQAAIDSIHNLHDRQFKFEFVMKPAQKTPAPKFSKAALKAEIK